MFSPIAHAQHFARTYLCPKFQNLEMQIISLFEVFMTIKNMNE